MILRARLREELRRDAQPDATTDTVEQWSAVIDLPERGEQRTLQVQVEGCLADLVRRRDDVETAHAALDERLRRTLGGGGGDPSEVDSRGSDVHNA